MAGDRQIKNRAKMVPGTSQKLGKYEDTLRTFTGYKTHVRRKGMFGIGLSEILVIAVVGILLFGGNLPEVAYSMGKFMRKVQRGFNEIKNDIDMP